MKKIALFCVILLLVVCGCGKKYTLEEQQAAFTAWDHEFSQKAKDVKAVEMEEDIVLRDLRDHKITPAEADARWKPLNEKFDQAVQGFDQLPDAKALSQEDQQTLKDCARDMKELLGGVKKVMTDSLDNLKAPNPSAQQALIDDGQRLKENLQKILSKINGVSTKLKAHVE